MVNFDDIVDFESFNSIQKKELDETKPKILEFVDMIYQSTNPSLINGVTHSDLNGDKYFAEVGDFVIWFYWNRNYGVNQLEVKPKFR